jgi:hypothetical protein
MPRKTVKKNPGFDVRPTESPVMSPGRAAAKDDYLARMLAEHAALRDRIMAMRPGWDRDTLARVRNTYGPPQDPGLQTIIDAIATVDGLEARFGRKD